MKINSAILTQPTSQLPFGQSKPLSIEEISLQEPGENEVLVKIMAAGLCQSDISVIKGAIKRPLPMALGHEAAGIVERIGKNVTNVSVGDKVITTFVPSCGKCLPCSEGRPALCIPGGESNKNGTLITGSGRISKDDSAISHHVGVSAFSTYSVMSENSVVKVESESDFKYLALFGCAVITGVGAVINSAKLRLGESVAIVGLGGVGFSALLGAIAAGASRIIVVDINPIKLQKAKELGNVEVYTPDQISAKTDFEKLDAVIETAGVEAAVKLAFSLIKRGGRMVTTGLPSEEKRFPIPLMELTFQEKEFKGSYLGSCVPKRDIPNYVRLFDAGKLPVDKLLTKTIGFSEINEGFDALLSGEEIRIVMEFDK